MSLVKAYILKDFREVTLSLQVTNLCK